MVVALPPTDLVPVLPGIDAASAQFNYRNGLCVLQPRRHQTCVINARKSVLVNYETEVRYTPRHLDSQCGYINGKKQRDYLS